MIVRPKSHKASCIYGAGTKWCTTERDDAHWKIYYKQDLVTFYYILQKKLNQTDPLYKIAVAVYPDGENKEVYDAKDRIISFKEVLKLGLKEKIFEVDVSIERKLERWVKGTYKINKDGSVDVNGSVELSYSYIENIPLKFNKVSKNFWCFSNMLTSLEGVPKEVGGNFLCNKNNLTSLEGAPEKIGGDFKCFGNNLTSLKGVPEKVGGDFDCNRNNLTSLEGAPKEVGRDFDCNNNNLTSLEGAPKEVGGDFDCSINNLTSLKGVPEKVGGDFKCSINNLTSLKGAPKEVGKNFDCSKNKVKFTKKDVKNVCNVKGRIIV